MDAASFCKQLADRVSPDEWRRLESFDHALCINEHNRSALLEMRAVCSGAAGGSASAEGPFAHQRRGAPPADVDVSAASCLEAQIKAYLDEYMADAPEGHKWIILASLYLTFVAKRPMHPLERAGVVTERIDGEVTYRCPSKVVGDNPICDSCVCLPQR